MSEMILLVLASIVFLPFAASVFGRVIWSFLTLVCCAIAFYSIDTSEILTVLLWTEAWLLAFIGISSKRSESLAALERTIKNREFPTAADRALIAKIMRG